MTSDNRSRGSEETIEREASTISDSTEVDRAEEVLRRSRERAEKTQRANYLSEAAFDLGFGFIELSLVLAAMIILVVSLTTSLSLISTAGLLVSLAAGFEIIRNFIKRLDRWTEHFERFP